MAYTNPETQVMKQMDFLAKIKQTWTADLASQSRLWTLVDASQDVSYENATETSELSAIDTKLANAKIGSWCGDWFTLHNSYFTNVLSYPNGLISWLDARRLRVNEDFAEIYYEVYGLRLASKYVFPDNKSSNILATLPYTGSATLSNSMSTNFSATRLALVGSTTLGAGNIVVDSIQAKNTIQNVTATFANNITVTADLTVYIGESTPSSITTSATTSIALGNNDGDALVGFSAGQYVLIVDTDPAGFDYTEFVIINSYDSVNKVIVVPALVHSYNLSTTRVYPCFNEIEAIARSSATASAGNVTVVPVADRIPLLSY